MQPFESDGQDCMSYKKRGSYVAQKVKMLTDRKLWA